MEEKIIIGDAMKIYKLSQIHPLNDYEGRSPNVNWNEQDNYGIWTKESVAKFCGVPADQYVYQAMIDLSALNPRVVEEIEANESREGRRDDEARELFYDEAEAILQKYNESEFHNPELDEWRDYLVWEYDESDVMDLAREMLARQDEEWGLSEMAVARNDFPPVVVIRNEDGSFEVADGNHRIRTWKETGYDVAPAWVNDEMMRSRG